MQVCIRMGDSDGAATLEARFQPKSALVCTAAHDMHDVGSAEAPLGCDAVCCITSESVSE